MLPGHSPTKSHEASWGLCAVPVGRNVATVHGRARGAARRSVRGRRPGNLIDLHTTELIAPSGPTRIMSAARMQWCCSHAGVGRCAAAPAAHLARRALCRKASAALRPASRSTRSSAPRRPAATATATSWEAGVRRYQRAADSRRVEAQPGAPPIVILPGFGNCSEDYTAPFGNEEAAVAAALRVSFGCVCPSARL